MALQSAAALQAAAHLAKSVIDAGDDAAAIRAHVQLQLQAHSLTTEALGLALKPAALAAAQKVRQSRRTIDGNSSSHACPWSPHTAGHGHRRRPANPGNNTVASADDGKA